MGAFEAGRRWAGADFWVVGAFCVSLKRRFENWSPSSNRSYSMLFMAFPESGAREAIVQMREHLTLYRNRFCASSFMAASHDLVGHVAVRGVGLCTGRVR